MHHSDLDALEPIKHPGLIHNKRKACVTVMLPKLRKAIASNDPRDWEKYKKLRNKINNNIRTSKAYYYSNVFIQSKGNPRKTWQTFDELTSRRVNNTTVKELKLNDAVISNPSELSNAFNDYFLNNWAQTC